MREIASSRLKIGMEIHVELATRTKIFSRVGNVAHPDFYEAEANSLIDPIVCGLPGALPVMNKRAIEMSIKVGLALNCKIGSFSKWDRKNYFYPDLPKGYQISQYDLPLCFDGSLEIETESGGRRRVGIIRAHLEEDAGKLSHELPGGLPYDGSLVDLNRAGTPLLEIVTQPDMESADEAVLFAQELRDICRFLGVSGGIMQRGHLRFEPNINVTITTKDGHEYVTPIVEVKNLNSFKAIRGAIEYEHVRQINAWKNDGLIMTLGSKRTRGWDDVNAKTVLQREKEEAHDYRYFPEPDLVPVVVSDAWRDEIAKSIPELPMLRRKRYIEDFGLNSKEAHALTSDRATSDFYELCIEASFEVHGSRIPTAHPGRECAKWLLNAGAQRANELNVSIHEVGLTPKQLAQLIDLRDQDQLGSSAADQLFMLLCESEEDALTVATKHGLIQVTDSDQLNEWIDAAIASQPQAANDFKSGKDAALGRLVGEVMKRSKGQVNAQTITTLLHKKLRK